MPTFEVGQRVRITVLGMEAIVEHVDPDDVGAFATVRPINRPELEVFVSVDDVEFLNMFQA